MDFALILLLNQTLVLKQTFQKKQESLIKQERSNKNIRSGKKDSSSKQDRSNKRDKPVKQENSNKQDISSKQDISTSFLIDVDPNILCEKLREILGKPDGSESDNTKTKMRTDELLMTRSKTRKQYNGMCEQIGLV